MKFTGPISIFPQVLGLSLAVLILSSAINMAFVLGAPDPPPPGYTLDDAVAAYRDGKTPLPNGRVLKAQTVSHLPDALARPGGAPVERLIRDQLAEKLGVEVSRVYICFERRDHMIHREVRVSSNGPRWDVEATTTSGATSGAVVPLPPRPGAQPARGPDAGFAPPGPPPPDGMRVFTFTAEDGVDRLTFPPFSFAVRQDSGAFRAVMAPREMVAPWQWRLLAGIGFSILIIVPLAWLIARQMARPIIAFSQAAATLSVDADAPPVTLSGPAEVQAAAAVMNDLQARLRRQIENRTALMGAIAHDLKTPLARLRLRIEDIAAPLKDRMASDISHMDQLITSAMSFTAAQKLKDSLRPLDLSALCESLTEDLAEVCNVREGEIAPNVTIRGDAVGLKRILTNLIENAHRYGGGGRVSLLVESDQAVVRIDDEGPGLPEYALETVFEPFYRLEASRNRDTGGTGLGLSVARALAEAQGGRLRLRNREGGGLRGELRLPLIALSGAGAGN